MFDFQPAQSALCSFCSFGELTNIVGVIDMHCIELQAHKMCYTNVKYHMLFSTVMQVMLLKVCKCVLYNDTRCC